MRQIFLTVQQFEAFSNPTFCAFVAETAKRRKEQISRGDKPTSAAQMLASKNLLIGVEFE